MHKRTLRITKHWAIYLLWSIHRVSVLCCVRCTVNTQFWTWPVFQQYLISYNRFNRLYRAHDRVPWPSDRYDTIRDAILMCARKPTWVGLIYRTEPTTKKCKNRKTKSVKDGICSEVTLNSLGNPYSESWRRKGKAAVGRICRKGRKVLSLEWKRETGHAAPFVAIGRIQLLLRCSGCSTCCHHNYSNGESSRGSSVSAFRLLIAECKVQYKT